MSYYICKQSHCNIIEFCHSEDLPIQFWGKILIFDSFSRIYGNSSWKSLNVCTTKYLVWTNLDLEVSVNVHRGALLLVPQ